MRKSLIGVTLAVALALPGAGLAIKTPPSHKPAAEATKTPPPNKRAAALKACKAERARLGAAAFEAKYGTGKKHKNALGKCVSAHVKKK